MRIGDVARRTGLSVSCIRFYEARKLLPRAQRAANGYRTYSEETVATLRFVHQAQALGFSLAEIKAGMPGPAGTLPPSAAIVEALQRKEAEIERLIEQACAKKSAIAALLEELDCVETAGAPGRVDARHHDNV